MKTKKTRREFSLATKKAIIAEAIERRSVAEVLTKHRIADGTFYRWVRLYQPNWDKVFDPKIARRRTGNGSAPSVEYTRLTSELEKENAKLRRMYMDLLLSREP
jgi:transposase-like protein